VKAQPRRADQAALEREHAGAAQPVRVAHRHVDLDAHRAAAHQLDAAHAADGKAGKRHVHADQHAVRVVGAQVQGLRLLERAARPHQVQRAAHQQQRHGDQEHHGAPARRAPGHRTAAARVRRG
jgi:hypothetical protein